MESSLCWKHLSGCFISRIFSAPCFILQLPYAVSPPLLCVQAPTHTCFIASSHPICFDMLFFYFAGWRSRVFLPLLRVYHTKPAFAGHISCVWYVLSSPFSAFFSLLSPPCRPISHDYVRGVCCPTAVQAGKWDEGKQSGAGSLRVFSCQSHKPSQYPPLKLGETKNMGMSLD